MWPISQGPGLRASRAFNLPACIRRPSRSDPSVRNPTDQPGEVGPRGGGDLIGYFCKSGFDFLFLQHFAKCAVEISDCFGRCLCWNRNTEPVDEFRAEDIRPLRWLAPGEQYASLWAGRRQRSNLSGLDVRLTPSNGSMAAAIWPPQEILNGRRRALIRDVNEFKTGSASQHDTGEMPRVRYPPPRT